MRTSEAQTLRIFVRKFCPEKWNAGVFFIAAAGVQPGTSRVQAGAKPVEIRAGSRAHPGWVLVAGRGLKNIDSSGVT